MRPWPLLAAAAVSFAALIPTAAHADAGSLSKGDMSFGLTTVYEPFNSYWYYRGPESSQPYDVFRDPSDYTRYGLSNYETRLMGPDIASATRVNLWNVGVHFEFGLLDRLSLFGETMIVHGDNGTSGTTSMGDTHLGAKIGLTKGSPVAASLVTSLKIPGLYDIQQVYSPGDGQPDLDFKLALGGLAMRRRLFYDVGLGYRFRFPFSSPTVFQYVVDGDAEDAPSCLAGNQDACELYEVYFPLDGPANESFLDATVGYFASRKTMIFATLAGVDSHYGVGWDDLAAANQAGADGSKLFTELEEDYVRAGLGVLLRPMPSMTAYASYSYTVWGRNTAAFLKTEGGVPIGTIALGVEFTFGSADYSRKGPAHPSQASLDPEKVLAMRFSDMIGP